MLGKQLMQQVSVALTDLKAEASDKQPYLLEQLLDGMLPLPEARVHVA